VPSLLGEDASELYAKNQYNLLALFMKNNVVEIDWSDEVLAKTVLTHAGENKADQSDDAAKPAADAKTLHVKATHARPATPVTPA
jgi:NAD(P) transhydrogenase subunit alpha